MLSSSPTRTEGGWPPSLLTPRGHPQPGGAGGKPLEPKKHHLITRVLIVIPPLLFQNIQVFLP